MQGSANKVWADHIKTAPCQWLEISIECGAGAKLVAVGWALIRWGIIAPQLERSTVVSFTENRFEASSGQIKMKERTKWAVRNALRDEASLCAQHVPVPKAYLQLGVAALRHHAQSLLCEKRPNRDRPVKLVHASPILSVLFVHESIL